MSQKRFLLILFIAILIIGVLVKNPFVLNMLSLSALTVIVVIGLNLLLGFAGQISLGHAGFVALGAYISSILSMKFNINPWAAIFIAVFLTSLFGAIIAYPTLKLKSHYLAMATLAIGEIIHSIANNYVELTGGPQGLAGMPILSIFGFSFDSEEKFYFFIWSLTFLLILLSMNFVSSRFGRAYKAIKSKENAATAFGINVHLYKVFIFTVSVFYASLAGALYAFYLGFVSPSSFDLTQSIDYVVMVVIGGMGSFFGVFFTSVILSILPNLLTFLEDYWPIANGLLLIAAMMYMPNGLKGLFKWIK
jgi:branched-chain amino acid transport system permease protein